MIAFKKPQSQGSSKKQYDTSKKNLASNGYLKIEACFSKNTKYKYKIFQCRLVQLIWHLFFINKILILNFYEWRNNDVEELYPFMS